MDSMVDIFKWQIHLALMTFSLATIGLFTICLIIDGFYFPSYYNYYNNSDYFHLLDLKVIELDDSQMPENVNCPQEYHKIVMNIRRGYKAHCNCHNLITKREVVIESECKYSNEMYKIVNKSKVYTCRDISESKEEILEYIMPFYPSRQILCGKYSNLTFNDIRENIYLHLPNITNQTNFANILYNDRTINTRDFITQVLKVDLDAIVEIHYSHEIFNDYSTNLRLNDDYYLNIKRLKDLQIKIPSLNQLVTKVFVDNFYYCSLKDDLLCQERKQVLNKINKTKYFSGPKDKFDSILDRDSTIRQNIINHPMPNEKDKIINYMNYGGENNNLAYFGYIDCLTVLDYRNYKSLMEKDYKLDIGIAVVLKILFICFYGILLAHISRFNRHSSYKTFIFLNLLLIIDSIAILAKVITERFKTSNKILEYEINTMICIYYKEYSYIAFLTNYVLFLDAVFVIETINSVFIFALILNLYPVVYKVYKSQLVSKTSIEMTNLKKIE